MKMYKRLSAITLAGAMIFATGIQAFAAEDEQNIDTNANNTITVNTAEANTAVLKKAIAVTNYDGYAYEPTITYTYTLANGTADGTVTNTDITNTEDLTVAFKAGDINWLADDENAVKTAEFNSSNAVTGETSSRDLTWTFAPDEFPSAGVYRYKITETPSVDPAAIGIDRSVDYDTEKFLDVYVKNKDGEAGLAIYGMVVVDDENVAVDDNSAKSEGWNINDDLEIYETYNMTITKLITGAGADMNAKFPFTVNLEGKMDSANIATETTGEQISAFGLNEDGSATVEGTLGHEASLTIKGLPKTVSFSIKETNNTRETYQVTTAVEKMEGAALAEEADLEGDGHEVEVLTDGAIANASGAIDIKVTNDLAAISPTGVVLRYAPYLLILAAGIVIFLVSRRRRDKED